MNISKDDTNNWNYRITLGDLTYHQAGKKLDVHFSIESDNHQSIFNKINFYNLHSLIENAISYQFFETLKYIPGEAFEKSDDNTLEQLRKDIFTSVDKFNAFSKIKQNV